MNDQGVAALDDLLADYLTSAALAVAATECEIDGERCSLNEGVKRVIAELMAMKTRGGTCWLIGNGGSGTIADHIACDMVVKHGWRAAPLTNPALTTTMANDYGGEFAFALQVERLARRGDVLIGMSCSGESDNIVTAMANAPTLYRIGLTGFRSANRLRRTPLDVSFWTPADDYGAVQISHLTLLHAIIDLAGSAP